MDNFVSDSDKGQEVTSVVSEVNLKAPTVSMAAEKEADPELLAILEIQDTKERMFRLGQYRDSVKEECLEDGAFYRSSVISVHPLLREAFDNDCCTAGFASKCSSCGTVYNLPEFGTGALHKRFCPICSSQESKGRAMRTRELLYGYSWKHLGCLDLTTHSSFVDLDKVNDVATGEEYLIQRQKDLMNYVQIFMREQFPDSPFIMTFHHWHSSDPLSGWHFHVHLVFLCSRYITTRKINPDTRRVIPGTRRLRVEHFKQHLTKKKLEVMKLCWSQLVNYEQSVLYYRWLQRTEKDPKNSRNDSEFSRVKHRLRYMFRGYVQDVNTWLNTCDELGELLPGVDDLVERVNDHLRFDPTEYHQASVRVVDRVLFYRKVPDWKRRTVYCGALSPSQINKWAQHGTKSSREEILWRIAALRDQGRVCYCSSCHAEVDRRLWYNENVFQTCVYDPEKAPLRMFIPREPPESCLREWVL